MQRVERKDLVLGQAYYLDNSLKSVGVFVKRVETGIYFDCEGNVPYIRSSYEPTIGLVGFIMEGNGFIPAP